MFDLNRMLADAERNAEDMLNATNLAAQIRHRARDTLYSQTQELRFKVGAKVTCRFEERDDGWTHIVAEVEVGEKGLAPHTIEKNLMRYMRNPDQTLSLDTIPGRYFGPQEPKILSTSADLDKVDGLVTHELTGWGKLHAAVQAIFDRAAYRRLVGDAPQSEAGMKLPLYPDDL